MNFFKQLIFEQEKQLLEKHNIQFITILDTQYPALLKEIHLPPSGLYIQGSFSSKKNMAIIGSRKANEYGRKVIHNLIPELVAHEWTIVSGGALGADTFAHEETLINNGKTIAILGSGLLQPYPLRNKKLFNIILEKGGAVASPFPLQMLPQPGNFPARNRIISGLSKGCIVAQAAEKSGASITAHFALEQGREVFAVPGIIDDPLSVGCHRLIQEGAKLITHVNDILEEFGEYSAPKKVPEKKQAEEVQNSIPAQKEITHPILKHCKKTISIDELHQETGLTIFELQQQLFDDDLK